jgi:hypothetical protein
MSEPHQAALNFITGSLLLAQDQSRMLGWQTQASGWLLGSYGKTSPDNLWFRQFEGDREDDILSRAFLKHCQSSSCIKHSTTSSGQSK